MSIADFKAIRQSSNYKIFIKLLEDLVDDNYTDDFKNQMKSIIEDARDLSLKKKNYFQLGNEYYNVRVFLSHNDPGYFSKIKRVDKRAFRRMLDLMRGDEAINCFKDYFDV